MIRSRVGAAWAWRSGECWRRGLTSSHISRMTGPATVRVFLRGRASVAALPAGRLDECHRRLDALLPGQFGRARSVLEADLADVNAILHPPGMVCNAGWIEATKGECG